MGSDRKGISFFGTVNESSLWAASAEAWVRNFSSVSPGHIAFFLIQSGLFSLSAGAELLGESRENGSIFVIRPGSEDVIVSTPGAIRGIVAGFEISLLRQILDPFRPGLREDLIDLVFQSKGSGIVEYPLNATLRERLIPSFSNPPVQGPARSLWYESQLKEMISLTCFGVEGAKDEFFCSRQKRLSRERIDRAKGWLNEHFEKPFDLQHLSKDIGVSPCYLSRTFSAEEGMTISQYLRRIRVERAADLLVTGGMTVSEAAIEVGYQSLSHFSKAFLQVKGCLPSKYTAA